ncbi:hypothetical protein ABW19_dt0203194 [Dactylella cylindrospora]|nr:hypothetical protein ABW19_dt0203194 [Dactylella cylindrospora]
MSVSHLACPASLIRTAPGPLFCAARTPSRRLHPSRGIFSAAAAAVRNSSQRSSVIKSNSVTRPDLRCLAGPGKGNIYKLHKDGPGTLTVRGSRSSNLRFIHHQPAVMTAKLLDLTPYLTAGGRFRVVKHIIPAFPIREHLRGTWNDDDKLQLVVNHYKPTSNPDPKPGDLTLIVAHANGFHKELYEPFFEYLIDEYESRGVKLRGIWCADMHCQGESGVLNEKKLGGDVSWFDHSRDVLSMIMHFPDDIVRPIAGIGHSMGGAQLFRASLIHPTLFTCLIGVDPVISAEQAFAPPNNPASMSAKRRDIWESHEDAVKFFKSRPFYQSWDSRVLDIHMKYGLRHVPTAIYPDVSKVKGGANAVTLTTTKHQEVFTFFRTFDQDRKDPKDMFRWLPDVRVPVLYLQGGTSVINWGDNNEQKMKYTPQPCEMQIIDNCGHLVPMEKPEESAKIAADYLYRRIKIWGKQAEELKAALEPSLVVTPDYFEAKPQKAKI